MVTFVNKSKLRIYNTLNKDIEEFQPLNKESVGIYACGLTVNDYMHIGHARTYIVWDVLVRYLRFLGYKVLFVSNITDISIDDKILKRLKEEKISFQQLIEKYTKAYFEDRESIGLLRADVHP
ncbi:MAG: arginine--tRNA ligase, partial [Thermoproteota archaeon]